MIPHAVDDAPACSQPRHCNHSSSRRFGRLVRLVSIAFHCSTHLIHGIILASPSQLSSQDMRVNKGRFPRSILDTMASFGNGIHAPIILPKEVILLRPIFALP